MSRPAPRLVAALLWLAIALLPLRALGMAWMQAGTIGPAAVATVVATVAAPADAVPCHGGLPAAPAAATDGMAVHLACQLCDLCHAGVTVAPASPALGQAPASAAPDEVLPSHPGRVAPDGLFRPPR
ncbi:MAG TPA: hypothetical protein VFQ20_05515 [Burkholderiaceae bacterium]|nr:hypothetical protein [Burkholderiaceae bacterium]